ncbi:uncharacterized protein E5676_scaffold68G001310 [Cucumis melo var. makuwa]|nr:uncharacterized protein E5676_scaffold68G001310 [Cucumis melo var. makuwa]
MLLELLNEAFPNGVKLPVSYYEAKKRLRDLGMGYESIHVCKFDCALFWKDYASLDKCPHCGESRYRLNDRKGKQIPHKVLRYFPLKARLQRLFLSKHTAEDMRWHRDKRCETKGILRHPADAEGWKHFDEQYPCFASHARNVRLALSSDGFNPFGNMSTSYSMWPVILIPYNLPPWKCMKAPFTFLSLLIPGPRSPGKEIDIYLQPLIDELNELWVDGIQTYDSFSASFFQLRAALLWTINDFPAYGDLSGWRTKVMLFKCEWYDTSLRKNRINIVDGFTSINTRNRWYKDEPFILVSQAAQVFYVDDYKLGQDWKIVQQIQPRHVWDIPEIESNELEVTSDETISTCYPRVEHNLDSQTFNREDVEPSIIGDQEDIIAQLPEEASTDEALVDEEDFDSNNSSDESMSDEDCDSY